MEDRFLLKLLTAEAIILIAVCTLFAVYQDYFAWLFS
jgi:hypothetical protein